MSQALRNISLSLSPILEVIFFSLIIALGLLCIDTSTPDTIAFMVTEYIDSAVYSQVVGVLLVAMCAGHLLFRVWPARKEVRPEVALPVLAGATGCALYALGLSYIGFYVSSFVFLALFSSFMESREERRLPAMLGFAGGSTLAMFLVFEWCSIYLPPAWLF